MKISRMRPWGALALGVSICSGLVSTARVTTAADSTAVTSAKKKPAPLDSILRKLKLDSDQKTAIKAILDEGNAKIKALAADTTLTVEEKQAAHKAICDEAFAAIRVLLDNEQKEAFDAWLASQPKPEDKPKGDKPNGGKPNGEKPSGEKPSGDKPGGKPGGGGSGGDCDKPGGDKPKPKPTARPTAQPTAQPTAKPTATPKPTTTYPTTGSGNIA